MQRRKHSLKVGDYLKYTVLRGSKLADPLWCVITEMTTDQGRADVLLRGSSDYVGKSLIFDSQAQVDKARRTTFGADELPDEVCVEIARRALLGVAN